VAIVVLQKKGEKISDRDVFANLVFCKVNSIGYRGV
jgi:hypothetical protein